MVVEALQAFLFLLSPTSQIDLEFHQHQHLPFAQQTPTPIEQADYFDISLLRTIVQLPTQLRNNSILLRLNLRRGDLSQSANRTSSYLLKPSSSPLCHAPLTLLWKSVCCRLGVKRVTRYLHSLSLVQSTFSNHFPPTSPMLIPPPHRVPQSCPESTLSKIC